MMKESPQKTSELVKEILGYLNFSSGEHNPKFFQAMNTYFRVIGGELQRKGRKTGVAGLTEAVFQSLENDLLELSKETPVFKTDDQAGLILRLVREHFLPEYRQFHSDLLHHQSDDTLFNSFFSAKVFETILQGSFPWTDTERIVKNVLETLNDYIGYRPVPVLEGEERHQPYAHEWVAPIPLFVSGAGVAYGRYQKLVEQALVILSETDEQICREACFDLKKLQELVLDPRAYDFDHPVNRKPNYHFGIWDPLSIDSKGFFNRFVVHQVTLDGIMHRMESAYLGESDAASIPPDELLYEASSVLAGTILMGAGVCGDSPQAFDSDTALDDLMPVIAGYRDKFYEHIVKKIPDKMKPRILEEKERLFQPFGGCRQSLNRQLAKRRADQLQRMQLSRIFAQMGYFDAAHQQTDIITVPSARLVTNIDCHITQAHHFIDSKKLNEAAEYLPQIQSLIQRGIRCGAIVDPWTIIGFEGNFSLFHHLENSIRDHRIDDLIDLVEDVFDLYSRLQKEAAATGNGDLQADLSDQMSGLASWWDQYGSTEIEGLESFSGTDAWESAAIVSTALAVWHKAGSAAGDIAFWNRHVERFKNAKAYVLLAVALLDQQDMVASMALMMHWLSRSGDIPLTEVDYSFHPIALRWIEQLWEDKNTEQQQTNAAPLPNEERWKLTKKFFDYLEANAEEYWSSPTIDLDDSLFENGTPSSEDIPRRNKKGKNKKDDEDNPYRSVYEGITYEDSANDGVDGSMLDVPSPMDKYSDGDDDELMLETERISEHLTFIMTVSKLYKFAAERAAVSKIDVEEDGINPFDDYLKHVNSYRNSLEMLLRRVASYIIPAPRGTANSLMEYDRHRGMKEILIDRIVWTMVELNDARMMLTAYLMSIHTRTQSAATEWKATLENWEIAVLEVYLGVFAEDKELVLAFWYPCLKTLSKETTLYVPTSRGGVPWEIVRCRSLQQALKRLMQYAPCMGLLIETFDLLHTIKKMEEVNTLDRGAITEFDRLVETTTRAVTKCVALSSVRWKKNGIESQRNAIWLPKTIVDYMEQVVEHILTHWLSHSRKIRISPIESLLESQNWYIIREFIQRYGKDIFTQQNMGFGNLRAILHQGVDNYLQSLLKMKSNGEEIEMAAVLLEDIARKRIDLNVAASHLDLILESIAENYSEYVDYNSMTTHSDHGEKVYMLLDMLRVQIGYDRIAWNLKPVYWIHDELIRNGCDEAAMLWEQAVARRSVNSAEDYLRQYNRLSEKYGMWLPSIHERLQERFIRPLQIDRMCGLVPKAVKEVRLEGPKNAFQELYLSIENFAKEPMGVGFEAPEWLSALSAEITRTRLDAAAAETDTKENDAFASVPHIEQSTLTRAKLDKILQTLDSVKNRP